MLKFLSGAGEAQGAYSWQHLTFVTSLMIIMVLLAVYLGKKFKNQDFDAKNKVLIWAAILIDGFELAKIIILCALDGSFEPIRRVLPLFLCSIQLIAIPVAAFTKGKLKNATLDFIVIFGILGALAGTYGAAQNYGTYPVLSWPNIVSGITHSISGFASLYILLSGMRSMKKDNIPICLAILTVFCVLAYIANITLDYNYMFMMAGDGTPYDIFYNIVKDTPKVFGTPILYSIIVVVLFYVYILGFYGVYFWITKKSAVEVEETIAFIPAAEVEEEAAATVAVTEEEPASEN